MDMIKVLSATALALLGAIGVLLIAPDSERANATARTEFAPAISQITPLMAVNAPAIVALDAPEVAPVLLASADPSGMPRSSSVLDVPSPMLAQSQASIETIVQLAQNAEGTTDQGVLRDLTRSVLQDLGVKIAEPEPEVAEEEQAPTNEEQMRLMTEGALAGILAVRPAPKPKAPALDELIAKSIAEGRPATDVDALLAKAADDGRVIIPDELVNSEGKVDTRTLLAAIAERAATNSANTVSSATIKPSSAPAVVASTAPAAKPVKAARPAPEAPPLGPGRIYTVTPGDSLAYISVLYYGSPAQYTRIFEANKDQLDNPAKISVGQKLVIPE